MLQAEQLTEKARQLDAREAALRKDLHALAGDNDQLASAQAAVQSAAASNKQISADLAKEQETLAQQLKKLNAREAELESKLEACNRALQVRTKVPSLHRGFCQPVGCNSGCAASRREDASP